MPEIRYTFTASDANTVVAAFNSIEQAAKKSTRAVIDQGKANAKATKGPAGGQNTSSQKTRDAKRAAANRHREEIRQAKAAAKELENIAKKKARTEERIHKGHLRRKLRAVDRHIADRKRAEKKAQQDAIRAERDAQRASDRIRRGRRRMMMRAGGYVGRGIMRAGRYAATAALGVAAASAREGVSLENQAQRLAIKGQTGVLKGQRLTGKDLERNARGVAALTPGVKASGVLEGMGSFVQKVGRVDVAKDFSGLMAKVSMATGASMRDIGSSMADMFQKFDVKTVDDMANVMATLNVQGKKGAFELSDMAKYLPKIAAAGKVFGVEGAQGAKTLGGVLQLIRTGTGTGAEAGTAAVNLMEEMSMKRGNIKKATGREVNNDIVENIVSIAQATGGTTQGLDQFKFQKRARRAMNPFVAMFRDFKKESGSAAKATKMLREAIMNAVRAKGAEEEMDKDAQRASKTTQSQMTHAWNSISASLNESLMPAVLSVAKTLSSVAGNTNLFEQLGTAISNVIKLFGWLVKTFGSDELNNEVKRNKARVEEEQLAGKSKALKKAMDEADKGEDPIAKNWTRRKFEENEAKRNKAANVFSKIETGGSRNLGKEAFVNKVAGIYAKGRLEQEGFAMDSEAGKIMYKRYYDQGVGRAGSAFEQVKNKETLSEDPFDFLEMPSYRGNTQAGHIGEKAALFGSETAFSSELRRTVPGMTHPLSQKSEVKIEDAIRELLITQRAGETLGGEEGSKSREAMGGVKELRSFVPGLITTLGSLDSAVSTTAAKIKEAAGGLKPAGSVAPGAAKVVP